MKFLTQMFKKTFRKHHYSEFCLPFPEHKWRIHGYCDKCNKWVAVWMFL